MPSKKPKLGQNFLIDESACLRIADALGDIRQRTVVEIGPGHGAITSILAQRCRRLHCVEFDPSLARELSFRFRNDPHVTVHHADILQFDLATLLATNLSSRPESERSADVVERPAVDEAEVDDVDDHNLDVIGNLPYYITSDILLHLFATAREDVLRRAVLMLQREVAERVTAQPGSSDYGALSAATQMHAKAMTLFTLPPDSFSPPPEVYSSVIRLEFAPRFVELGVDAAGFNRFLRAGFAQKRKTLQNNLRVAGFSATEVQTAWPPNLPAQVRAEAVPLEDMAALYSSLGSPSDDATEPGA